MASHRLDDVGVVLHRRPYRETSLIVDVLTAEHGRLGVVAKGARRGRKDRLEPLHEYALCWSGSGDLHTLISAERVQSRLLAGEASICALYMNELLMRLLARDDPQASIYQLYGPTLANLAEESTREPALRHFELGVLDCLGYGFVLDTTVDGKAVIPGTRYDLLPDAGLVLSQSGDGVLGESLLAIARDDWSKPQTRRDARSLTRAALAPHLGHKPLEAFRLLKRLRSL